MTNEKSIYSESQSTVLDNNPLPYMDLPKKMNFGKNKQVVEIVENKGVQQAE